MPEITDQELNMLRSARQLLDQLMSSSKTKKGIQSLVKTLHPNVTTDDDMAKEIVAPVQEKLEALEKWKKEREDKEIEGQFNSKFDALRKEGWTDDGIEKLKKLMVDRQNGDVDSAVALFEKQNPAPKETPEQLRSRGWADVPKGEEDVIKKLMTDENAWAREEATKVINEIRGGQVVGGDVGFGRVG
jgi:hypothetical protein